MKLMHHGSAPYETQKGIMATNVRAKFEATIRAGAIECQRVLEQLDADQPTDAIAKGKALRFVTAENGVEVVIPDKTERIEAIHDHALGQFAQRRGLPMTYARHLLNKEESGDWGRELLAKNLNELYEHSPDRYLLRSVRGETRACLSDRYRRLDSRPLFQAFFEVACRDGGMVPTRGYSLATKTAVRVILPTVFEPIKNEPMLFGLEWHNSDFGDGTHSVRAFIHRPFCTNEATTDNSLKQIHLGGKLADDIKYSQRTYQLDQKTSVSALRDTIKGLLSPGTVDNTMRVIAQAGEKNVEPRDLQAFLKANLQKGDAIKVVEAFNSPDVENLPPGNTRWRLSNAISFIATKTEDKYKALELERLAGKALAA